MVSVLLALTVQNIGIGNGRGGGLIYLHILPSNLCTVNIYAPPPQARNSCVSMPMHRLAYYSKNGKPT